MPRILGIFLAACALIPAASKKSAAQYQTRTWLEWRTIESGRFAFHFPTELEGWARLVAGKIRSVDSTVSGLVGFTPAQRIDVVIDDPFRIPNGSAWPSLDDPAIVLWATPPGPRDDIGTYVSWADLLAVHEYAHLAHLLRPTRNGWQSLLWAIAPVEIGPVSRKAPRWMVEGYATYIEGIVTGSGRPNGVWRQAILRQWAVEGALPTYGQLNSTQGMYGGGFAYLAGSAFIEWLIERRGDRSMPDLWKRLTASRDRNFRDAFVGIYGESPEALYGRFAAGLTAAAKRFEQEAGMAAVDSGRAIQRLTRETGDPAISANGSRVAITLASASRPGRVVIWSTLPEPDSLAQRADSTLLARDPLDVAPYRPFPAPKRALATLHAVGNQPYLDPRFFRDGRVLVWRNSAVGDGSFTPDLYVWDPQRDRVTRVTVGANVREGDPSPDGSTVAATRCGAGTCHLMAVDARTGAARVLAPGSDTRSYHRPRFAPDGAGIVAAVRDSGFWRIATVAATGGEPNFLTPAGVDAYDPSFAGDSTIIATTNLFAHGQLAPTVVSLDAGLFRPLASVSGAAVAPEFNPADSTVWFLALHARGWDVRSAPLASRAGAVSTASRPALGPIATGEVEAARRYNGPRRWTWLPGVQSTRTGSSAILGLVNTDPVGKHELLVQISAPFADDGGTAWAGGSASLTSRSRFPLTASLFTVEQDLAARRLRGGSLSLESSHRVERSSMRALIGGSATQSRAAFPDITGNAGGVAGFGELAVSATRFNDGRRTTALAGVAATGGRRGSFEFGRITGTATISSTEVPVTVTGTLGRTKNVPVSEQFVIGTSAPAVLPTGVLSQFVGMPALVPVLAGEKLETWRVAVPIPQGQVWAWGGRAWSGTDRPRFERVNGIEFSAYIGQIAALGTPAARITVGAGHHRDHRNTLMPVNGNVLAALRPGAIQFYAMTQFGDWSR